LIILGDAALDGGQVVARRIIKSAEDWNSEGHLANYELTLSLGLAEMAPGKTLDQVLAEADQNMYAVKEPGRGGHGPA
jgi:GGDEF domain-containing protein